MNLWWQDNGQAACAAAFLRTVEQGGEAPIGFDELMEVRRVAIEVTSAVLRYTMQTCISFRVEDAMHVAKWGNSLAVRLPAAVVEALDLKEGDDIEIDVVGSRALEMKKMPGSRELLARLRKFRGRLPADFRFDRLEAHERGK